MKFIIHEAECCSITKSVTTSMVEKENTSPQPSTTTTWFESRKKDDLAREGNFLAGRQESRIKLS
jgi:hypothetical protein